MIARRMILRASVRNPECQRSFVATYKSIAMSPAELRKWPSATQRAILSTMSIVRANVNERDGSEGDSVISRPSASR